MDWNISNEEKKNAAQTALNVLKDVLCRELLMNGFVPDEFSIASLGEGAEDLYPSIFSSIEKINNLEAYIESL